MLPLAYRRIYKPFRFSFLGGQKLMENRQILELAQKHSEVELRVRVVSLTNKSIRVEHTPLLGRKSGAADTE